MAKLTHRGLGALQAGEWVSDGGTRGGGTLVARRLEGVVLFYFRYTTSPGVRDVIPLGAWSGSGGPLSLEAARDKASELSRRYRSGDRDLKAVLEAEVREDQRQREVAQRAHEAAQARKAATLGALLEAYVQQLQRDGKASATEVTGTIRRHVTAPWPKLTATPADEVTTDDLLAVIARVVDDGKHTEARKLRAYLHAAYQAAIRARQDARGLAALRDLRITTNPTRDLAAIDGGSNARDRALSVAELRSYWRRIEAMKGATGALLRFHLLTGAQRVEQLRRLTTGDFDADAQTVRLRDGKGRRKAARAHDVPLIPAAAEAMQDMASDRLGPHLFTVTAGESGADYSTLYLRMREVAEAMAEAGELEKGPFTPGDLRRTTETRLAAEGVSVDDRAQLQSHGLGGVQSRHYDRHDYLPEKREALETLYRVLTGAGAKVVQFKARTA